MRTYELSEHSDGVLYKSIYENIKKDIFEGKLKSGEKLPSKRTLATNLGVSIITVENAYEQLICEGYLYAVQKKGYFVSDISDLGKIKSPANKKINIIKQVEEKNYDFDFSSNLIKSKNFPFSVWAKLLRENISNYEHEIMKIPPCNGTIELRNAIAKHLLDFRGMQINPDQIVIGAGTEYLYGILIKLLGEEKIYCIENPGYSKLKKVYESNNVKCRIVDMDENGIMISGLRETNAHIAHISPTHHFPTGITMPVTRRYELLAWANENKNRYIIEDDYDSEFRINGKPLPTLQSIDSCEKVIYMNTFSKSLAPTIRISYMILPEHLINLYYKKLSFMSCTVSNLEQYTLAAFINQGYFEKHINRMRLHYKRQRDKILEIIKSKLSDDSFKIIENGSGLHFILEFKTEKNDDKIKQELYENKIKISAVTDYYMDEQKRNNHQFILNYSNIDIENLELMMDVVKKII